MIIEDKGIILKITKFQESKVIVKCFLQNHGVISGLSSKPKLSNAFAEGNIVYAKWQGKASSLGYYTLEPTLYTFAIIAMSYQKMLILNSVIELLCIILQEHDAQHNIFNITEKYLNLLTKCDESSLNQLLAKYLLFEISLLKESGFGLDLSKCVVSGKKEELEFISPRSGCAVSKSHGLPYANKLFKIPQFFITKDVTQSNADILNGFMIMNHFIEKYIISGYHAKNPIYRGKLYESLKNSLN